MSGAAASLLLLVPVFWQRRIQAGDLASHVYCSWLTRLVEGGRLQRFTIAPQHTNVLFDFLLSPLLRLGSAALPNPRRLPRRFTDGTGTVALRRLKVGEQ